MPCQFNYKKYMMPPYCDHPWRRRSDSVAKPVGSEPELPDWSPEHFDCYAATAELYARTPIRVSDEPRLIGKHPLLAAPYGKRIASDRRAYVVGTLAVTLGLLVMVGTIGLYLYRPASSHVTLDNWCDKFRGALSCPDAENSAGK